jgi:hypothetical protein
MVAFKANDEESAEIEAYAKGRHFRDIPSFARFAIFAYIRQNRPGGHRREKGTEETVASARGAPPDPSDEL